MIFREDDLKEEDDLEEENDLEEDDLKKDEYSEKEEYLTDEALESLLAEIEDNELVAAPPDLMERILDSVRRMEAETAEKQLPTGAGRAREFRMYCIRVMTAAAAAILLVFTLPVLFDTVLPEGVPYSEIMTKQEWLESTRTVQREELLQQEQALREKYRFGEDASNSSGLLEMLGDTRIFSDDRIWNIFR